MIGWNTEEEMKRIQQCISVTRHKESAQGGSTHSHQTNKFHVDDVTSGLQEMRHHGWVIDRWKLIGTYDNQTGEFNAYDNHGKAQ